MSRHFSVACSMLILGTLVGAAIMRFGQASSVAEPQRPAPEESVTEITLEFRIRVPKSVESRVGPRGKEAPQATFNLGSL